MLLRAYGARKNKEAENYPTEKKSKILQVNATYPPINSLASTFNLSAHNPGLLFLTPVKKLFQEEHLARHGSIHPHLAPFCCKVEKTPARTACTLGTAGNTWCSHHTGTCVCRAGGPSSRGHSGKQHSLCCFLPAIPVHLQPARPFPATLCQCCSHQGRCRWRRVQDYLQTWRAAKMHISTNICEWINSSPSPHTQKGNCSSTGSIHWVKQCQTLCGSWQLPGLQLKAFQEHEIT